ncbi:hypothetical protein [Pseudomonas sp. BR20]|uniref:hypothetical protein n=1 Tax=Pseudomonas sp. BR20 TaxID=3137452 RepID=UPI003D6FAF3E
MSDVEFDLQDPRNVIYQYGGFDVSIVFAWENVAEIPSAARLKITRQEPFAYTQMDQVTVDWSSFEDAVTRLKNTAKFLADDMLIRS